MKIKRWWMGGVALTLVAVAAGVAVSRHGKGEGPVGNAQAATSKDGKDGKDGKPADKPLEFTDREAVRPLALAIGQTIEFSGALVAPNTATVRAKAAGTLVTLSAVEGQRVAAGTPLGRIDVSELQSRVAERKANLEAVKATQAQAERTHNSNVGLADQHYISPIALETSKSQLDTARAQVNAAAASLESSQVALREAALQAPIAGVISKRQVVAGEKVSAEQPLLTIVDLRTLELAGLINTADVSRLAPGMAVDVQVEGIAQAFHGKLARIAPAAEPGTRSIGVVVQLANPQERLRAGQYAVAKVAVADATPRLTVPLTAISTASGQDYVWTVEDGKLLRRTVTSGRRDAVRGRIEILEGLKPEALVLGARFDNLREGAPAKVLPATAASTPAAVAAASTPQIR